MRQLIVLVLCFAVISTSSDAGQFVQFLHNHPSLAVRPADSAFWLEQAMAPRASSIRLVDPRISVAAIVLSHLLSLATTGGFVALTNGAAHAEESRRKLTMLSMSLPEATIENRIENLNRLRASFIEDVDALIAHYDDGPDSAEHDTGIDAGNAAFGRQVKRAAFIARTRAADIHYDPDILLKLSDLEKLATELEMESRKLGISKALAKQAKNAADQVRGMIPEKLNVGELVIVGRNNDGNPMITRWATKFIYRILDLPPPNHPLLGASSAVLITYLGPDPMTGDHRFLQEELRVDQAQAVIKSAGSASSYYHAKGVWISRAADSSSWGKHRVAIKHEEQRFFRVPSIARAYPNAISRLWQIVPAAGTPAPSLEEMKRMTAQARDLKRQWTEALKKYREGVNNAFKSNEQAARQAPVRIDEGIRPFLTPAFEPEKNAAWRLFLARDLASDSSVIRPMLQALEKTRKAIEQALPALENRMAFYNVVPDARLPDGLARGQIDHEQIAFAEALDATRRSFQHHKMHSLPPELPTGQPVEVIQPQAGVMRDTDEKLVIVTRLESAPGQPTRFQVDTWAIDHNRTRGLKRNQYRRDQQLVEVKDGHQIVIGHEPTRWFDGSSVEEAAKKERGKKTPPVSPTALNSGGQRMHNTLLRTTVLFLASLLAGFTGAARAQIVEPPKAAISVQSDFQAKEVQASGLHEAIAQAQAAREKANQALKEYRQWLKNAVNQNDRLQRKNMSAEVDPHLPEAMRLMLFSSRAMADKQAAMVEALESLAEGRAEARGLLELAEAVAAKAASSSAPALRERFAKEQAAANQALETLSSEFPDVLPEGETVHVELAAGDEMYVTSIPKSHASAARLFLLVRLRKSNGIEVTRTIVMLLPNGQQTVRHTQTRIDDKSTTLSEAYERYKPMRPYNPVQDADPSAPPKQADSHVTELTSTAVIGKREFGDWDPSDLKEAYQRLKFYVIFWKDAVRFNSSNPTHHATTRIGKYRSTAVDARTMRDWYKQRAADLMRFIVSLDDEENLKLLKKWEKDNFGLPLRKHGLSNRYNLPWDIYQPPSNVSEEPVSPAADPAQSQARLLLPLKGVSVMGLLAGGVLGIRAALHAWNTAGQTAAAAGFSGGSTFFPAFYIPDWLDNLGEFIGSWLDALPTDLRFLLAFTLVVILILLIRAFVPRTFPGWEKGRILVRRKLETPGEFKRFNWAVKHVVDNPSVEEPIRSALAAINDLRDREFAHKPEIHVPGMPSPLINEAPFDWAAINRLMDNHFTIAVRYVPEIQLLARDTGELHSTKLPEAVLGLRAALDRGDAISDDVIQQTADLALASQMPGIARVLLGDQSSIQGPFLWEASVTGAASKRVDVATRLLSLIASHQKDHRKVHEFFTWVGQQDPIYRQRLEEETRGLRSIKAQQQRQQLLVGSGLFLVLIALPLGLLVYGPSIWHWITSWFSLSKGMTGLSYAVVAIGLISKFVQGDVSQQLKIRELWENGIARLPRLPGHEEVSWKIRARWAVNAWVFDHFSYRTLMQGTVSSPAPGTTIAVGDTDGDLKRLKAILFRMGLIDGEGHWKAQGVTLVQMGDVVGRTSGSLASYRYLQQLQAEATQLGGRVIQLVGNHEWETAFGRWIKPDLNVNGEDAMRQLKEEIRQDLAKGTLQIAAFEAGRLFVHAGLSKRMKDGMSAALDDPQLELSSRSSLGEIVSVLNELGRRRAADGQLPGGQNYILVNMMDGVLTRPSKPGDTQLSDDPQVIGHAPGEVDEEVIRPQIRDAAGRVVLTDIGIYAGEGGHLGALEISPGGATLWSVAIDPLTGEKNRRLLPVKSLESESRSAIPKMPASYSGGVRATLTNSLITFPKIAERKFSARFWGWSRFWPLVLFIFVGGAVIGYFVADWLSQTSDLMFTFNIALAIRTLTASVVNTKFIDWVFAGVGLTMGLSTLLGKSSYGDNIPQVRKLLEIPGVAALEWSPAEYRLIEYLIEHPKEERREIAKGLGISGHALDEHVSNIRKRLAPLVAAIEKGGFDPQNIETWPILLLGLERRLEASLIRRGITKVSELEKLEAFEIRKGLSRESLQAIDAALKSKGHRGLPVDVMTNAPGFRPRVKDRNWFGMVVPLLLLWNQFHPERTPSLPKRLSEVSA